MAGVSPPDAETCGCVYGDECAFIHKVKESQSDDEGICHDRICNSEGKSRANRNSERGVVGDPNEGPEEQKV